MKKLMFIVFAIYLLSCNTFQIREDIKIFVDDLILNPTKLDNMEGNYPSYFDSTFFNLYLNDLNYRNMIIKFILDTFSLKKSYTEHGNISDLEFLLQRHKYKVNKKFFTNVTKIYNFHIVNGDDNCLYFYFAEYDSNKRVLFDISTEKNYSKNFYP